MHLQEGVHVITVNDYLAKEIAVDGKSLQILRTFCWTCYCWNESKAKTKAYACDVTYGTNNEFGFDYLRDNMVIYKNQLVQRKLKYAIVDEIDVF
ncbi:MAG: hypothetical protein ACLU2J_02765 [Clostridia bacterium]